MQTIKNLPLAQRIALIVLTAALVGCLAMIAATPARSALTYFSDDYVAEIQQTHIGVVLTEQTGTETTPRVVAGDNQLIQDPALLLAGDATIQLDTPYAEKLSVQNASDDMDEYVRLTVRKYWATGEEPEEGAADPRTKTATLNPAYIKLTYDADSQGDWVFSPAESNDERLVFYYKHLLKAGEAAATPAVTEVAVDSALQNAAESYEDCWLGLSAQVDSVQVNNAYDAAKSAWGIDVSQFEAQGLDWSQEN